MLVLSSPSGAGKTTISRRLLEAERDLVMSVSATTRPRRPGEVDGQDYYFVDPTDFSLMVNRSELLEHAKVFGNYYGTPRQPVEDALAAGRDVLFDIDRSEAHTSELQSLMRISYAVSCLKKKKTKQYKI